jgi:hypothetical protein
VNGRTTVVYCDLLVNDTQNTSLILQNIDNPFHGFVCGTMENVEDQEADSTGCFEIRQMTTLDVSNVNRGEIRQSLTLETLKFCEMTEAFKGTVINPTCIFMTEGSEFVLNPAFERIGEMKTCTDTRPGVYKELPEGCGF